MNGMTGKWIRVPMHRRFTWRVAGDRMILDGTAVPGPMSDGLGTAWEGDLGLMYLWTPNSHDIHLAGEAYFTGNVNVATMTIGGGRFRIHHDSHKRTVYAGILSSGGATLHDARGDRAFGPGHGMIMRPGDDRSVTFLPDSKAVLIECPVDLLDEYRLPRVGDPLTFNPSGTLAEPIREFATAVVGGTHTDPLSAYMIDQLLSEMLVGTVLGAVGIGQLTRAKRRDPFADATEIISARFMDSRLTVTSIAATLNISPRRLQEIFASQSLSVNDAIRHRRLKEAQRLLEDPAYAQLTVNEVSQLSGFGDVQRLRRAFRAARLPSPMSYRMSSKLRHTETRADQGQHTAGERAVYGTGQER